MEERRTARLLVVDDHHRVLLMRIAVGQDAEAGAPGTDGELWVTLGGGIEPGETALAAAERELREETGILDARVGPVVGYGEQVLQVHGAPRLLKEHFVLVRCPSTLLDESGWTAEERDAIAEMRWWPLDEVATTSKTIKPPGLATLLREILGSDTDELESVRTIALR